MAVLTLLVESHNVLFYLEGWELCQNRLFLSAVFLVFQDGEDWKSELLSFANPGFIY